jgi:16S rRNA (guanine(1405)-N(7))-methyltransferase
MAFHATLAMKLLPLLEGQLPGGGCALLARVKSERALVTFPTRTLSGRSIGMRSHYEASFEQNLPANSEILDKFLASDELCYVLSFRRR